MCLLIYLRVRTKEKKSEDEFLFVSSFIELTLTYRYASLNNTYIQYIYVKLVK